MRSRALVLLTALTLPSAVGTACSSGLSGSSEAPAMTTSLGTGDTTPNSAAEQRCTVVFQTPTSGQTSARRTVILIEIGEDVAMFDAGQPMPPLDEIPGCEPK